MENITKKKKQAKLTVNSDKGYGDGSAWASHCYVNNFSHLIEYIQSNLIVADKYSTFTSNHPRSSSINISLRIKRFIDLVKNSSGIPVFLFLVLFKSHLSFTMRQRKKQQFSKSLRKASWISKFFLAKVRSQLPPASVALEPSAL